jgi:hypothetical protein
MLERYGYPEQSLSQVLISIESCVACLSIQRKSEEDIQILYVMFHYHCGLILWRFWKVPMIDTEIIDILHKAMKTALHANKEFWREGGACKQFWEHYSRFTILYWIVNSVLEYGSLFNFFSHIFRQTIAVSCYLWSSTITAKRWRSFAPYFLRYALSMFTPILLYLE